MSEKPKKSGRMGETVPDSGIVLRRPKKAAAKQVAESCSERNLRQREDDEHLLADQMGKRKKMSDKPRERPFNEDVPDSGIVIERPRKAKSTAAAPAKKPAAKGKSKGK